MTPAKHRRSQLDTIAGSRESTVPTRYLFPNTSQPASIRETLVTQRAGETDPQPLNPEPAVSLIRVSRVHEGGVAALAEIDLEVDNGRFLTVVGPSGSGKTTLLRVIAGLDTPSSGDVRIAGRRGEDLPPWRRGVAMVFQQQPPYPHLNVYENLAFSLRAGGPARGEVRQRVLEIAELLGLAAFLDRRPQSLSGGEARRVVLGRALAKRPRILLLDEPTSGLDAPLRASMRTLLDDLHRRLGLTVILVTHDQQEALALGQRVALLDKGRLVQLGTPTEVYQRPDSVAVARFLGDPPMNLVAGVLSDDGGHGVFVWPTGERTPLPRGVLPTSLTREGGPVLLGLHAEHVELVETGDLDALAVRVHGQGGERLVELASGAEPTRLWSRSSRNVCPGDRIGVRLRLDSAVWFDPATGRRIAGPDDVQSVR